MQAIPYIAWLKYIYISPFQSYKHGFDVRLKDNAKVCIDRSYLF